MTRGLNIRRHSMLYQKNNFYDYFIILIIVSTIIGTVQVGFISHTLVIGLLCLPLSILELISSYKQGKVHSIVLFMIIWILYALISAVWSPKSEYILSEIWNLLWNITIFIGLFYASKKANNTLQSFLIGWRMLLFLTLFIAAWEITTDSHIPKFGDFNEGATIDTGTGLKHRIFAAVTYKNLNSYVTLLCMAFPYLAYGLFILEKQWLSIIVLIGSILVLIVNSSRGGLMCLAIDVIVFALIYRKQQFAHKKLVTSFVLIAIVYFIYSYGMFFAEQAIGRLSAYGAEDIMSDVGRWDVWRMGIEFCINSFGFGCGVGSMQPMYASTGFWLHFSHNMVIEFILQYGIWLFIPLGIMLLKNWIFLIKEKDVNNQLLGWMLMLSFIPLAIIDDSYIPHAYTWLWLVSQFTIVRFLQNEFIQLENNAH